MAEPSNLAHRARAALRRRVTTPVMDEARHAVRRLRNRGRVYRPLFVCGAMGSGTTLLAFLLGQRLDTAGVVAESARHISRRSCLHVDRTDSFASIADFERAIQASPDWSLEAARADLQRLYRSRAVRSSDVIVDKGPNTNLTRASFLKQAFPDARFVLIYRDPVANIEGFRRKWKLFGRSPLDEAIGFYRRIHESFLQAAERFPADVRVVDYAQLVAHDAAILEGLGQWARVGPASESLALPDRENRAGRGARNVVGGEVRVVSGADRSSYERLAEAEISAIRDGLADLAQRLSERAWRPAADGAPAPSV
ncbi:MAG: sulfotransferase family protein [Myxococcota bacterium]